MSSTEKQFELPYASVAINLPQIPSYVLICRFLHVIKNNILFTFTKTHLKTCFSSINFNFNAAEKFPMKQRLNERGERVR